MDRDPSQEIMRTKPLDIAGVKFVAHWIAVAIDR